jgi:hypothetical protein
MVILWDASLLKPSRQNPMEKEADGLVEAGIIGEIPSLCKKDRHSPNEKRSHDGAPEATRA